MHYLKIVKMNGKKEISTLSSRAVFWKKKFHHLANLHASLNRLFHIPSILKNMHSHINSVVNRYKQDHHIP